MHDYIATMVSATNQITNVFVYRPNGLKAKPVRYNGIIVNMHNKFIWLIVLLYHFVIIILFSYPIHPQHLIIYGPSEIVSPTILINWVNTLPSMEFRKRFEVTKDLWAEILPNVLLAIIQHKFQSTA